MVHTQFGVLLNKSLVYFYSFLSNLFIEELTFKIIIVFVINNTKLSNNKIVIITYAGINILSSPLFYIDYMIVTYQVKVNRIEPLTIIDW